MRVGIFGTGRLGSAIADAARARPDVELAWTARATEQPSPAVDVAIDASVANAVWDHIRWAHGAAVPLAVGVTGWQTNGVADLVGDGAAVLIASNFSLTVALAARFARIIGAFTDLDDTRDPYVTEHHHRLKTDAPSGTAITLADAVVAGSARTRAWTTGMPGPDELHVAALRAGSEFGRHTVGFDSPAETLELVHHARSRAPFADGALTAARWLIGRTGVFTMADVAADVLDPLFRNGDSHA